METGEQDIIPQDVLNELNYSSSEDVALEYIILQAKSKIAEYEEEVQGFQKKYNMDFDDFQQKLENTKGDENFDEEEDFMAWKFAKGAIDYWREQIEILENAA